MRGGSRVGSGRKKGRQNVITQALRERLMAEGISPLEFLLETMRDPDLAFTIRMDAARTAAPFLHPKLATIQHTATDEEEARPQMIEVVFVEPEAPPTHDLPLPEGERAWPMAIQNEALEHKALTFLR